MLNDMPKPPPIFKIIQNAGNISKKEMYRTFNMGIGFCLCVDPSEEKKVVKTLSRYGQHGKVIGYVENKIGVYLDGKRLDD
jgi:phosphoribosylformylglycinamidine cyclo-ligase